MPPAERFVPCFAAEPPQEAAPYGRWKTALSAEFLAACVRIDGEGEDLGEPGELTFYPDRTWRGRTYVPVTTRTSSELELYGYVAFTPAEEDGEEPTDFHAVADFTAETAERNPDWKLDICDEVIDSWRGEEGNVAAMTLVWGTPLTGEGAIVTAELAALAVDQCQLREGRFTLIAPDDYRGDYLEVRLWDRRGRELASESLYVEDDGDEDEDE